MRLSIACLVFSLLAACDGATPSAPAIDGKLVVHTAIPASNPVNANTRVLLGDGTRFNLPLDAQGDVTFQDPSLKGPQTITIVEKFQSVTSATTMVGIDAAEVWYEGTYRFPTEGKVGTVAGKVTGIADAGDRLSVELFGAGDGSGTVNGDAYTFDVYGPDGGTDGGTATLVALEQTQALDSVRVGMRTGVPVGGDQTGFDVALDHPFDQSFPVTVPNADAYGGAMDVFLDYRLGSDDLFASSASGTSPLAVPAIARTAPFDALTLRTQLSAGDWKTLPQGALTLIAAQSGESANITLPAQLTVSSPAIGTVQAPSTVSAADFHFAWSADPNAQMVVLDVDSDALQWTVWTPAAKGAFSFFPLPSNASPVSGFTGALSVVLYQVRRDGFSSIADYFAQDTRARTRQAPNSWQTALRGAVNLQ